MTERGDGQRRGHHHGHRREYREGILSRDRLPADPLELFGDWLDQAIASGATDATAMALATATPDGVPSVRIVLLKEHGPDGFVWFTDYGSRKGRDLAANPVASLVFHWREFSHQVRISGAVARLDRARSETYFASRPADSRFSAAASDQSQPVSDRETLEARVAELRRQYPDGQVPMPEDWGGYVLTPQTMEFWQGREGRLHDRFLYTRTAAGWRIDRLQP
ncbi:MAG: pyridoxamine 5'-phosphate oxidase [Pseudomonadales bacterium]